MSLCPVLYPLLVTCGVCFKKLVLLLSKKLPDYFLPENSEVLLLRLMPLLLRLPLMPLRLMPLLMPLRNLPHLPSLMLMPLKKLKLLLNGPLPITPEELLLLPKPLPLPFSSHQVLSKPTPTNGVVKLLLLTLSELTLCTNPNGLWDQSLFLKNLLPLENLSS
jgi:hypothetical protein